MTYVLRTDCEFPLFYSFRQPLHQPHAADDLLTLGRHHAYRHQWCVIACLDLMRLLRNFVRRNNTLFKWSKEDVQGARQGRLCRRGLQALQIPLQLGLERAVALERRQLNGLLKHRRDLLLDLQGPRDGRDVACNFWPFRRNLSPLCCPRVVLRDVNARYNLHKPDLGVLGRTQRRHRRRL